MKKTSKSKAKEEILPEYDFRGGVRGKYAKEYAVGTNIVVLSPEIAKVFPNSEAVNKALAKLIQLGQKRSELQQSERSSQTNYSFRRRRRIEG
jgi:hypothetical protein